MKCISYPKKSLLEGFCIKSVYYSLKPVCIYLVVLITSVFSNILIICVLHLHILHRIKFRFPDKSIQFC